jgi:hypothetical protein
MIQPVSTIQANHIAARDYGLDLGLRDGCAHKGGRDGRA